MSRRASGPPRRPHNPIARAVRGPKYRPRVIPDKRWEEHLKDQEKATEEAEKKEEKNAPE